MQPRLVQLKEAFTQSSELFKIPRKSQISKELLAIDTRRNNAIIGIAGVVRSYRKHFIEDYREVAKLLHKNLSNFGKKIYMKNY